MQELFRNLAGITSAGILFWYAWRIRSGKNEPPNPASWILWWIIDTTVLIVTYLSGKPIGLPLGWSLGAGFVVLMTLKSGSWMWSYKETLSAISTGIAVFIWIWLGPSSGVIAGAAAIFMSGIPIMLDMIRVPVRDTFPVWFFTALAALFTILGSDWTFVGTVVAWETIAYNVAMCFIVRRQR
ncbi:MAG: hypothetical protein AB1333_01305 [Patescibacteria group bacterium]